ncbi:MAG: hypothetical protein JXA03_06955 [Bacteroidales bacterium]|nr:hypothetical protein [Bacteroidales bacterium]
MKRIYVNDQNEKSTSIEAMQAQAVYQKVVDFMQRVEEIRENPLHKSGEMLSKEDAVWGLNAGLNLRHSEPDGMYNDFYIDSSFVSLPLTVNDSVSMNDIAAAYSEIESSAGDILNEAPFQDKAIKFTFIEIGSDANQNLVLKCTTIVGERGEDPEPPFNYGDDWRYGNNYGMCDDPTYIEDAGDQICNFINANRYLYVQDEGKIVFYTNPVTIDIILANQVTEFLNPNDPFPADNDRDYLMFYVTEANCDECNLWNDWSCIEYDDMNFYYFGTTNVIYNKIPYLPQYWPDVQNKTFLHLGELNGTNGIDVNGIFYIHQIIEIRYATRWVIEK